MMAVRFQAPETIESASHLACTSLLDKLQPVSDPSRISGADLREAQRRTGHEMSKQDLFPGVTPESPSIQPRSNRGTARRPAAGPMLEF